MWDDLMEYVHHASHQADRHLQLWQASGWITLVMSGVGALSSGFRLLGAITTDGVNQWFILLGSLIGGGVAIGCIAYHRVTVTRDDGKQRTAMVRANMVAIAKAESMVAAGHPGPYPSLPFPLVTPRGSIAMESPKS